MKKIVAGNWKMNMNYHEAHKLLDQIIIERTQIPSDVQLIVAPPAVYLSEFSSAIRDLPKISLAAQNCHTQENGAFTGEVSASMLASLDIRYCLVGHSERRQFFGETNQTVGEKVVQLLNHGIQPIICVGELLEERKNNTHFEVVKAQIEAAVQHVNKGGSDLLVWAYEPVWAIGTGETASAEQAQEMHAWIRKCMADCGVEVDVPILYGGSCKPDNASSLFTGNDVNGGLIGGAALHATDFIAIANSF